MSFSIATLSTQLQAIESSTFPATAAAWADAIAAYFAGAVSSNGVAFTTNGAAITTIKNAFISATNNGSAFQTDGADAIEAGLIGWWLEIDAAPGTYFAGGTGSAAPSGLLSIASSMEADVFVANRLETLKEPAMDRLASFLHGKNAGGTVTIGGVARVIS